jgi:hypothetical protein
MANTNIDTGTEINHPSLIRPFLLERRKDFQAVTLSEADILNIITALSVCSPSGGGGSMHSTFLRIHQATGLSVEPDKIWRTQKDVVKEAIEQIFD